MWDAEYASGKWQYQRLGPNNEDIEPIYEFVERYGTHGTILDLGCGSGMTALEMRNTFDSYLGVDVSDVAVLNARIALAKDSSRADKVKFLTADISSFETDGNFSVILFRESIYYVPGHVIKTMLDRYRRNLAPRGVFIVRICDRERFKAIIQLIEANFRIEETLAPEDSTMTIMVFRPGTQADVDLKKPARK